MHWGNTLKIGAAAAITLTLVVLVPSCSTSPTLKGCDRTTCSGCCAGSVCKDVGQQDFLSCGLAGGQCSACLPGQLCTAGRCERDPNSVPIVFPDAGELGTCGHRGQACCGTGSGCFTGLYCVDGFCSVD